MHALAGNRKSIDGFHDLLSQHAHHFDELNQPPFRRNASTSTLDLVGEGAGGDNSSANSHHRTVNIAKDKSGSSNKLDFNNICGMMRSRDPKDCPRRFKPAKNVYYIEERKDDEPSIFIIDPTTVSKHRKCHQTQKSLEDVRIHKVNSGQPPDCDATIGWNFMDRNYYGSRTLPRDFARRNVRPSLDNMLHSDAER